MKMTEISKMPMQSPDTARANFDRIASLFPSVIRESRGPDGSLTRTVDYEVLAELLGAPPAKGSESYEFTWPGKREARAEAGRAVRKTLRPCPEESVNWETTENLYIEGDNLDVLKLLQENYLGKVKMIYIDPPYNTGNDFIYYDDLSLSKNEYQELAGELVENGDGEMDRLKANTESNGRFHSDWCSMIYPRLLLARNLLSDDGVIFISCDDNEQENLKKICNEVFGEGNFAACIPWQSRLSIQNDTDFSSNHEYILVYAKKRRLENRRLKAKNISQWYEKDSFVFRPLPLDRSKFENPDDDPRGPWKADPFDAPNVRPNLTYKILNPNTGEEHLPPVGRCWRTSQENYLKALEDGRIIFGVNGKGRPQLKSFYNEKKDFGSIDNSWFSADRVGTATLATKELQDFFGNSPFDTPKPVSLIKKLCNLGFLESGDTILDFFAGSSTTAHAVMQLNAEDGGRRKFIMVQLPEICKPDSEAAKAGYANICEIGKKRIRRAGEKIKRENPNTNNLDTGFRVLKCDTSNMKDVYYTPGQTGQEKLTDLISNIREDRSDLDLFFGCVLDWGLELSFPHETKTINGNKVHFYNGNELACCFTENIDEATVRAIARTKPLRAVFRDSSFTSSDGRINIFQHFSDLSPDTEIRVL